MRTESDRRDRFERMFTAQYGLVLAYARRRAEPHVAQDVVAETFTIAWRRLDDVPAAELPWLYGVARRVLANELRAARRRESLAGRAAENHVDDAQPPAGSPLLEALARLGERDRELLLLTAWEGLNPAGAAAAVGCSRAAVRVRLHRARKRLAAELECEDAPLCPLTTSLEERQ